MNDKEMFVLALKLLMTRYGIAMWFIVMILVAWFVFVIAEKKITFWTVGQVISYSFITLYLLILGVVFYLCNVSFFPAVILFVVWLLHKLIHFIYSMFFCKEPLLSYSYIDNSILLTTKTLKENGFNEVWRQENSENSIQIICFNSNTGEFQAFDKFHRLLGNAYDEDLWTPIKLHYTAEWLQRHLHNSRKDIL